jgi:hypothetical protein
MRRGFSILLMLVFGLMPLSPLLEGSEDVNLPVCCRRHGAHHCSMSGAAMRAMMAPGPGRQAPVFAAQQTCPYYPGAATAFFTPQPALTALGAELDAALESMHVEAFAVKLSAATPSRTHAGRGPPAEPLS